MSVLSSLQQFYEDSVTFNDICVMQFGDNHPREGVPVFLVGAGDGKDSGIL